MDLIDRYMDVCLALLRGMRLAQRLSFVHAVLFRK